MNLLPKWVILHRGDEKLPIWVVKRARKEWLEDEMSEEMCNFAPKLKNLRHEIQRI